MKSIELDNLDGREIKKMLDNNQIVLEELDVTSLTKIFDHETDLLTLGCGDMELINRCAELIDAKSGESALDDDAFAEITNRIFAQNVVITDCTKDNAKAKRAPRIKRRLRAAVIVAAILAAVLAGSTVVATTFGFSIHECLSEAVRSKDATINKGNVTIYTFDDVKKYHSIEEMLESEQPHILYPSRFPEGAEFKQVSLTKSLRGEDNIRFFTENINVNIDITLNSDPPEIDADYMYVHNNVEFAISLNHGVYSGVASYNGDAYYIYALSRESLILMIENLEEYQP